MLRKFGLLVVLQAFDHVVDTHSQKLDAIVCAQVLPKRSNKSDAFLWVELRLLNELAI